MSFSRRTQGSQKVRTSRRVGRKMPEPSGSFYLQDSGLMFPLQLPQQLNFKEDASWLSMFFYLFVSLLNVHLSCQMIISVRAGTILIVFTTASQARRLGLVTINNEWMSVRWMNGRQMQYSLSTAGQQTIPKFIGLKQQWTMIISYSFCWSGI